MAERPAFYTVIGYADMDDGVETFTELVWCLASDAFAVAVAQALPDSYQRQFLTQATEIATFMGVCVDVYSSGKVPEAPAPLNLQLDPEDGDLDDLEVFQRTYPGATEDAAPVKRFHWYDAEQEAESAPFDTYAEALRDRTEDITG
ncbi:hypothetical protein PAPPERLAPAPP_01250 [Brevundimonas phage vB_BpoS-Papperlapapp]|uniref:Uncharacterized protein n=1 Tax=Brevundimonas phage vB_BpoS-Domovoi TaxID=2948598 RepID=A0A9E7MR05_9CAUD|nr:hypothetical protein DOMOVOI_00190 [Brevundimonas phage vB_BpoS-Domovoi]USN15867.1 hypothetical protein PAPPERLAPAPP_01250 [Brevundimonas phage vB_BpoS-Papperlapapp]